MPSKKPPRSPELDINTLDLIAQIRRDQDFFDRYSCPSCPEMPPDLPTKYRRMWNLIYTNNMVLVPGRERPGVSLRCSVCQVISETSELASKTLK